MPTCQAGVELQACNLPETTTNFGAWAAACCASSETRRPAGPLPTQDDYFLQLRIICAISASLAKFILIGVIRLVLAPIHDQSAHRCARGYLSTFPKSTVREVEFSRPTVQKSSLSQPVTLWTTKA